MTWISWIMLGTVITGYAAYGHNPPEKDQSAVGAEYCTKVVNRFSDTVGVFVLAPKTDSAIRALGILLPQDSGIALLPYHVPPMMLLYIQARGRGGWWSVVQPDSILPCRRVVPND